MTTEKIKNLINLGFNEKWLKDILSLGDDIIRPMSRWVLQA